MWYWSISSIFTIWVCVSRFATFSRPGSAYVVRNQDASVARPHTAAYFTRTTVCCVRIRIVPSLDLCRVPCCHPHYRLAWLPLHVLSQLTSWLQRRSWLLSILLPTFKFVYSYTWLSHYGQNISFFSLCRSLCVVSPAKATEPDSGSLSGRLQRLDVKDAGIKRAINFGRYMCTYMYNA